MKEFENNPRKISEKQRNALRNLLREYGDLSGITHNINTEMDEIGTTGNGSEK